jgi:hypothetical protein
MYNCTLQNNIRIMYTMSLSMLISCTHIHFLFYFIDHPEVAGEATMDSRAAPPAIPIPRRQSPPPQPHQKFEQRPRRHRRRVAVLVACDRHPSRRKHSAKESAAAKLGIDISSCPHSGKSYRARSSPWSSGPSDEDGVSYC